MVLDSTITLPDIRHLIDHEEIAAKLNSYVDAQAEYGVVADNTADDTSRILSAMNDMQTAGGGLVRLPRGTTKTSAPLVVPSDVALEGAGRGITTVRSTHAGTAIFMGSADMASGSPPSTRSVVRDLSLDGPNSAGSVGLEVRKCSRPRVRDVGIADYGMGHYINAGHLDSFCTGGVFENMTVVNCSVAAVVLGDPVENLADCTDNHFSHCYYNFNSDGTGGEKAIWLRRGNTNHFTDCSMEGADYGFLLGNETVAGSGAYNSARNFITACRAENIKRAEGLITAGTDNQILGGTVNWVDRTNGNTNRFIGTSQAVADRTGVFSSLSTALTASLTDQTINLANGAAFPAPTGRGVGIIQIGNEIIIYETRTGNQLTTCYRGCWGTTPAAHASSPPAAVTVIGQGNGLRVTQTINPLDGLPTASDTTRGDLFWESGKAGEGDALWTTAKDEGGTPRWYSIVPLVKQGAPADADFPSPPENGQMAIDNTNGRIYVRIGGVWRYAQV